MTIKSGRVILTNEIRGDWPIGHNVAGEPGVHDAYINPHGAVSIIASNGQYLGLKPSEFAWLEKPTIEIMPTRCGCDNYRQVKDLIVEKCTNCGDDEYYLYRNCRQIRFEQ